MVLFDDFIYMLDHYSVADVLLPFVLVFTLVYAVLQKSRIFGKESKKFNIVISFIMGLGVVIPHTLGIYGTPSVVDVINRSLPQVSLLLVAIVMLLILVGIFGRDMDFAGASLTGWAVFISLIFLVIIFGSSAGWFGMPNFLRWLGDPQVKSLIIIILVFGLIIAFVTSEPDKQHRKLGHGIGELFGEWFKKK